MNPVIIDFLQHMRQRIASSTYNRKAWQIETFCNYLDAKELNVQNVTRGDVETYLSGLKGKPQYRQSMCFVIGEFYAFQKVRYPSIYTKANPATGIPFKPDKSRKLFNVPSQVVIDELFGNLYGKNDEISIRNRLMAEFAYGSGLRRGELVRLEIEDIDLGTNTAHVTGKGNKLRIVPLTEKTADTIREYLKKRNASRGPLLLSYAGRRLSLPGVYEIMRNRVGLRPHLFRHACATHLLKNGCSIRVIQELLGHERIGTTYIYTMVSKENLREVLSRTHPRSIAKKS